MRPSISILIPVYNRLDLTSACLASIERHKDPMLDTEIFVIDDASTDGTADFIRARYPGIKLIQNRRRQSFGPSINMAARVAAGRFLCLLNNDTLVQPNWLAPLVDAALKDPTIGVVGNRQLWPDTNKVNHAGMAFTNHCEPIHIHVGQEPDYPPALCDREFQILTAACWLVPKETCSLSSADRSAVYQ